jgi:hypothetical protein
LAEAAVAGQRYERHRIGELPITFAGDLPRPALSQTVYAKCGEISVHKGFRLWAGAAR